MLIDPLKLELKQLGACLSLDCELDGNVHFMQINDNISAPGWVGLFIASIKRHLF